MKSHRQTLLAFVSGILFAIGLALGGMTQPSKVIAFLDVTGDWDPSLAFVMGAGVLVYMVAFRWIKKRGTPLFEGPLRLPTRSDIDPRLVIGAALFGAGWGLNGYCPGPALTSAGTGAAEPLLFVGAMIAGMGLFELLNRLVLSKKKAEPAKEEDKGEPAEPALQP